jgi:hypothetical protein
VTTPAVYACERPHNPPVPAVAYDTHADQVVCRDHSGLDAESAYACEFMLDYIPDDDRIHGTDRPTVDETRRPTPHPATT